MLGKNVNLRVADPDRDVSDDADKLQAIVEIHRLKTEDEIEEEMLAAGTDAGVEGDEAPEIERYKRVDRIEVALTEALLTDEQRGETSNDAAADAVSEFDDVLAETDASENKETDDSVHSGVFRGAVTLVKTEQVIAGDDLLQAIPGDQVRLMYLDESHSGAGVNELVVKAKCLEGNIGGVRVTRAEISDQELRVQTQLKPPAR